MYKYLVKIADRFNLQNWSAADHLTRKIFFWLPELLNKTGKTHCLMNLSWPSDNLIAETPQGYDTYIVSFHLEYADYAWLERFKKHVGQAKVVLINQFDNLPIYLQNEVSLITYDIWPKVVELYLQVYPSVDLTATKRTHKASTLANRVCQARTYVCAYIHKTWNYNDYVMSWRKDIIEDRELYLFNRTGNSRVDDVIDYIETTFFNLRIIPEGQETHQNWPLSNMFYNWRAYNNCAINFTNESVNNSYQQINGVDCIAPGPYLTEKTIKCLLSSTALIPVGQYDSYRYLETMGFEFDYPWDKSFDHVPQDITRFSMLFDTIDQIRDMDLEYIINRTKHSNRHNYNHIISGEFERRSIAALEKNLEKFINEN